jgi:uncharacterized membrane protein
VTGATGRSENPDFPMANGIEVHQSFTLTVPAETLYNFWRRLSDFPRFMKNVESVTELDDKRSHWVVRGPGCRRIEWDSEIVDEVPGRLLRWRTVGDADVRHGGTVEFRPATGNRGTVAAVHLAYEPPGGGPGAAIAKLLGDDPEAQIREDLRRFKSLVETGEIPTTEGQASGRKDETEKSRSEQSLAESEVRS